jgi:tRNA(fMet)-specific endonuclease VapC
MTFVLDTNVWSEVSRGVGRAGRKLASVPLTQVVIPAPALYELMRLPSSSPAKKPLVRFIEHVVSTYEVAPFDGAAAEAAADIANALTSKGRQISHLDTMIAGIAIARGSVLVTRDKDFKGIVGLKVEDWS